MNAIEFSGVIERGQITLPPQYASYDNAHVRVIVLVNVLPDEGTGKKERFLAALQKMKNMNMFSKIDDPVLWQKKLRDEWE